MFRYTVFVVIVAACTADMTFMTLGDWGGASDSEPTTSAEKGNAASIGAVAAKVNSSFTLLMGDNFYDYGIHGTDKTSPRFKETFEDVFTANSLKFQEFFVIAGNHDWRGNVTAQIAYTKDSTRWKFPSLYYTFTRPVTGTTLNVQFVMIDTVSLAGDSYKDDTTGEFVKPKGPSDPEAAAAQLAWIERELAASTAEYLFVVGHYPVYSGCSHGNTEALDEHLRPLLEKYKATAYMCGHDHCLEYTAPVGSPVVYPLVGAGKECCYDWDHSDGLPSGSSLYHLASDNAGSTAGGWMSVTLSASAATFTYHDANPNSAPLYRASVRPRQV